jgi:hypothetical protein
MEKKTRVVCPAKRVEFDRIHRFKVSIRRLINKFTSNTKDPLFQLKLWFNYKDKMNKIFVVKDIDGDAKFYDPDREFLNSNLSFDFGKIQMPKIKFKKNNKFVVLHELRTVFLRWNLYLCGVTPLACYYQDYRFFGNSSTDDFYRYEIWFSKSKDP